MRRRSPEDLAPEDLAPEDLAPDGLAPEGQAPENPTLRRRLMQATLNAPLEPIPKAFFEPRLRGRGQGAEKGLDREVIAHGVAFHHAPRSADEPGLAIGLRPGNRKSHLASAGCTEIDLHRQPPRQAEAI